MSFHCLLCLLAPLVISSHVISSWMLNIEVNKPAILLKFIYDNLRAALAARYANTLGNVFLLDLGPHLDEILGYFSRTVRDDFHCNDFSLS